jgi:hypothetical protein
MFTKLFRWLFGKKAASTVGGVAVGAATGAAAAASQGALDRESLIAGAITGAAAALAGAGGRGTGED